MADERKHHEEYARVIRKARRDEQFKKELLADPAGVLEREGVPLPDYFKGSDLRIVEDTADVKHLVLRIQDDPSGQRADDDELICC